LSLFALKGWFIGMQDTVSAMITDIVVNVVNMAASYVLAVYTPLGAIGVAWGTLIAQYAGLLSAAILLLVKYRPILRLCRVKESMRWQELKQLFVLNSNLFLRSLAFMVIYVGYTVFMSSYGDTELAVSAIIMKIFLFFSYFIDGFAYAAEAMVGKEGVSEGAEWRKTPEVVRTVRVLSVWTLVLGLFFSLLYFVYDDGLIAMMTSDATIQSAAVPYYVYLWLMPILSAFAFLFDGVFIGATKALPVRNCMFASAAAFVLIYAAAAPHMGAAAMYLAYSMHLVVRTVYLGVSYLKL
jgi:MATE family multidrug resistance protein